MKKLILSLAVVTIALTSCKGEKKVEAKEEVKVEQKVTNPINSYNVNVAESTVTWKGAHPVGEGHNGTITIEKGLFDVEAGVLKAGEFVLDMNTISCSDLEGKKKAGLEGHLKNEDFFNVEKFPSTKFVVASSEVKDGKLHITGNLTIKDVTKSITIPATLTENGNDVTLKSETFGVDRTDFGVKYGSGKFFDNLKDKAINDIIEFSFDIKARK
ncbi:YceI family protein [uncultured Tenacibaculum sp.]|uniref:YceI family protein n=1 Tax=uncultured Tenacibaculum sp. TaxID=174713 RepID=UPI0026325564|nr:YceI family protein [uncultured Tenacibaculum sp.]